MAASSLAFLLVRASVARLTQPRRVTPHAAMLDQLLRHAHQLLALNDDAFVRTADDLMVSRLRDHAAARQP